ncbi:MAG: hypothetical protein JNM18_03615 [Planctomycetaceae bacterium]|nr:hypothetical protein [Planctomycetaceae bacterium]
MGSCLDIHFWSIVALAALVMRALPVRRTIGFGLWNLLGLAVLGGWQLTASALVVTGIYWSLLRWSQRTRYAKLGTWAAIMVPGLIFVATKIGTDWSIAHSWLNDHPQALLLHRVFVNLAYSYVFLRMIEMAHCVIWKAMPLLDPLSTAGYLFPFHMIFAGPVNLYQDHLKMNASLERRDPWFVALNGADQIATGLIYKYVCAEYLRIACFGVGGRLISASWIDTAALIVYLFFDFAGYSRIMLGAGMWMGVPTPVNFNSPFSATTITDFFTRWHMSLGAFIQRNIFMPLQMTLVRRWGVRRAAWAGVAALVPAWAFVGLWHRFSLGCMVYGLVFAAVVATDKLMRDRVLRQSWSQSAAAAWTARLLGPVYVFVVVTTMLHIVITELMPA